MNLSQVPELTIFIGKKCFWVEKFKIELPIIFQIIAKIQIN